MKNKFLLPFLCFSLFTPLFVFALEFTPPEIEKVNWESRQLTAFDVDGDGRTDLATIDGIERSVNLFIQKAVPSLESSKASENTPPTKMTRFTRQRIATEAPPSAFIFGNFSGQGKVELAYVSKKMGLVFMERAADGRWTQTHRIPEVEALSFTHVLWAGKLGNTSAPKSEPDTLVALAKGKLLVIKNYQITASYGMLYENSGFVGLNDINGDGRLDISYDYEIPHGFAYRLQDSNGRFDRETLIAYAAESEKNFAVRNENIYFFGGATPFVEVRKITPTSLKPSAEIYGCYADRAQGVLVDLDGDSQPEFVLADMKGSELIVYRKDVNNWGNPEHFPSLKSVSQIAVVGNSLALLSPDEHAVGMAAWDPGAKRVSFPKLVEITDEPIQLFGTAGKAWVLSRTDKEFFLQALQQDSTAAERQKIDLKRAPDAVLALSQKDGTLLMFINSRDGAAFYFVSPNGALSSVKPSNALLRSNFSNLDESKIGKGEIDNGSAESLFIANRSTLRIFKFAQGQLMLADQASALNDDASLKLPFAVNGVLWAYDTKSDNYLKFERAADNLWKNNGQVEAPPLEPLFVIPQYNLTGWMALGRRAFYTLNPAASGIQLVPAGRWESNLKLEGFNWGSIEPLLGKTEAPAVILYNQPKRILEIVEFGETPKSLLNFEVYKQDAHYSGRTGEEIEPREIVSADATGDGKADLILLVHNRILLYPQK